MTTGACFTPASVRLTRASVRFAPGSAPLVPGPDNRIPASVSQPRVGAEGEDAPASPGPVSARDAKPGAKHADPGAPLLETVVRLDPPVGDEPEGR